MIKVAIVIGSTRPGRKAEAVARWVHAIAAQRSDAQFDSWTSRTSTCRCSTRPCPR